MLDCRRSLRPAGLFPAVLSILLLVALAPAAWSQTDPPARSDTITAPTQFLVCSGNPYALCYYSGPQDAPPSSQPVPALPCVLRKTHLIADCKCYAIKNGSVNYVALPSILQPEIRQATEDQCGEDGSGCLNMVNESACSKNPDGDDCQTAVVCGYLGDIETSSGQTFWPQGTLISTFSFEHDCRYPISSTSCTDEPYTRYAGCMTAGCGTPYTENGLELVDCACPTYKGPFQFGQSQEGLECDLGGSNVWSAADVTFRLPSASCDSAD
jgi:hypothetical protein